MARPEYLVVMSLQAFRPEPDGGRIASLYLKSDPATLDSLLSRFDDAEKTLTSRLQRVLSIRS